MAKTPRKSAKKVRAFGRSIRDFPKLNRAEKEVIAAARKGRVAFENLPATPEAKAKRRVRAGLVRFLALGGDDATPVHEQGVYIRSAVIEDDLDLTAGRILCPLVLSGCRLEGKLLLDDTDLRGLVLEGSCVQALIGNRLRCRGGIYLRNGFQSSGEVRLASARIEGDLDCGGGQFENPGGDALVCDRAVIDGDVFLSKSEDNREFFAAGAIRFVGARIGGDLVLLGSRFSNKSEDAKNEIWLSRAEVSGRLFFGRVEGQINMILLRGARAGGVVDDLQSWQMTRALVLDGFCYDRILDTVVPWSQHDPDLISPTDAKSRVAWLGLQRSEDLGQNFKPQPWEQLIKVLRETGHDEDAKEIAIEKQRRLRKAGKIKGFAGLLHDAFGVLSGYGYRPLKLIRCVAGVWLVCSVIYFVAASMGVMAPTNPRLFEDARYQSCRPENFGNWTTCATAPYEYTTFNAWIYSLATILPLVELQQEKDWSPMVMQPCEKLEYGVCVRSWTDAVASGDPSVAPRPGYWPLGFAVWVVAWLEILFGWLSGLVLVAVLSGLVRQN